MKFKKLFRFIDVRLSNPLFYLFVMSKNEKVLFDKYTANSKNYLEFGAGGSTLRVLQKTKTTINSVESSLDWINSLREYVFIRLMEKEKRLTFHHVNIGKIKFWGYPDGDDSKDLFPNYSAEIFNKIDAKKIDTILVDGRFRVASTLSSIINCHLNNDLIILIHDFWNREHYKCLLKYLDVVERVDTLGIFKIKKDIILNDVKDEYEEYKYIVY